MSKEIAFNISGCMHIPDDWVPRPNCDGNISYYETPDGFIVSLFAGLRYESSKEKFHYYVCDANNDKLQYDYKDFIE